MPLSAPDFAMLFQPAERQFAAAVNRYLYVNRMYTDDAEEQGRALLAPDLRFTSEELSQPRIKTPGRPLVEEMVFRAQTILDRIQVRFRHPPADVEPRDAVLYEDLAVCTLFYRFFSFPTVLAEAAGKRRVKSFKQFVEECQRLKAAPVPLPLLDDPAHLFALCTQIRRAVDLIPATIRGNSLPTRKLRAMIWNSIFPQEPSPLGQRLYGMVLFDRMHEITTLIMGPSGTGKELVARLVGQLRYVPFDAARGRFVEPLDDGFHAINLAALSPDLIESELFGHVAGAFTGAVRDKPGWFERCSRGHSVFLDEIGELDESIQVKLLRVLQSREFYRVGETTIHRFEGKVIAATNRDLAAQISAGRFREDLFYRLCSDVVETPSLREQLDDCPEDLPLLVRLVAERCLGPRATAAQFEWLTATTVDWIERSPNLGPRYSWPGNFRQLEQCIRNMMIRGEYQPPQLPKPVGKRSTEATSKAGTQDSTSTMGETPLETLAADICDARLTYDELLTRYCSLVFARSPNLTAAARRLDKHRATIESRIDVAWVERFRQDSLQSDLSKSGQSDSPAISVPD